MARPPRVYLAGPEVFLANARAIGDRKRAICTRHGLSGIFPGDAEPPRDPTLAPWNYALAISQANAHLRRHDRQPDAVPWRQRRRGLGL